MVDSETHPIMPSRPAAAVCLERHGKWAALLRPWFFQRDLDGGTLSGGKGTAETHQAAAGVAPQTHETETYQFQAEAANRPIRRIRLLETRSLPDCTYRLSCYPASVVCLEAGEPESTAQRIAQIRYQFPSSPVTVAANVRIDDELRWLWMELGACFVIDSPRHAVNVAKIMSRHLAQVPLPELTLEERIKSSLTFAEQ